MGLAGLGGYQASNIAPALLKAIEEGGENATTIRTYLLTLSFALLFLAAGTPAGRSQGNDNFGKSQDNDNSEPTFITIDFPGAIFTEVKGVTPGLDAAVGNYRDIAGVFHGFLPDMFSGTFTTIDFPGAIETRAFDMNSGGGIVGFHLTPDGKLHGYLLSAGEFTTIDVPDSTSSYAVGINGRGDMVGSSCDTAKPCPFGRHNHGYLFSGGEFTRIDFPGATVNGPLRINPRGDIVGYYAEDASDTIHSFLLGGGVFSTIDFPGAPVTNAFGINLRGHIVGGYCTMACNFLQIIGHHGFLLRDGEFSAIDFPGAQFTWPDAITPRGDIAGVYQDSSGKRHGFLISISKAEARDLQ